jgi:hypothetical protein
MRHALSYAACEVATYNKVAVWVKSFQVWTLLLHLSVHSQLCLKYLLSNPIAATTPELPEKLPVSP